jgi:CBS domain containing-hemolysin-like protein
VQSIVEASQAEGLLDDSQGLLSGALEFSDRTAADVMVPIDRLLTLPPDATPDDVERLVARTGYSRFPVAAEPPSDDAPVTDVAGYLHLKDVLYATEDERSQPVPRWRVRDLATVAPEVEIEEALAAMQRSGVHLARVDRGGRCVGVVFLEDILEELVGEVRDVMQRGTTHLGRGAGSAR